MREPLPLHQELLRRFVTILPSLEIPANASDDIKAKYVVGIREKIFPKQNKKPVVSEAESSNSGQPQPPKVEAESAFQTFKKRVSGRFFNSDSNSKSSNQNLFDDSRFDYNLRFKLAHALINKYYGTTFAAHDELFSPRIIQVDSESLQPSSSSASRGDESPSASFEKVGGDNVPAAAMTAKERVVFTADMVSALGSLMAGCGLYFWHHNIHAALLTACYLTSGIFGNIPALLAATVIVGTLAPETSKSIFNKSLEVAQIAFETITKGGFMNGVDTVKGFVIG
jgi:hypothetical protein